MKGTEAEACTAMMQACIPKVTRLTVVNGSRKARVLELWDVNLEFSLQDDCRTLKIFTSNKPKKRSEVTKDLHTQKYRQRVKPGKKEKPGGQTLEEILRENDDRD